MYVRLIPFHLEPGMYKTAEKLADHFAPILRPQCGLITAIFFLNDAAGEYGVLTLWESREDVEVEATIVILRLQDALAGISAAPPFIVCLRFTSRIRERHSQSFSNSITRRTTMKKLVCLTLFVLFATVLASCAGATSEMAEGMLKPGDKIGNMIIEEHAMSTKYPDIWDYCAYQPEEKEPGTQRIDCDVPLISRMEIGFGWGAENVTILDSNWSAMAWELHIDGYQINLDEFEQWSENGRPDLGVRQAARGWILDLNNLSPGKHTLRYLWTSEISIDDGFEIYTPGTYEHIVNFTVLEK